MSPVKKVHRFQPFCSASKDSQSGRAGQPRSRRYLTPITSTALLALNGNQRIRAVADDHERLRAELTRWLVASQKRDKREAELRQLERLLRHAVDLPIAIGRGTLTCRDTRWPPVARRSRSDRTSAPAGGWGASQ